MAPLYLKSFVFSDGKCAITLSNSHGEVEKIEFNFVRSFLFYKESDFFEEISRYEKERVVPDSGKASNVFKINKNQMSELVFGDRLSEDFPMFFGVWTPDECFEIVGFEHPTIEYSHQAN